MPNRKPYPTDVGDEEWAFVAPYLTPVPLDTGQRVHDLREVWRSPTIWRTTTAKAGSRCAARYRRGTRRP
jgi:transposase